MTCCELEGKKIKKSVCSILFFVGAGIVALAGVGLLIINIITLNQSVKSYVDQGGKYATISGEVTLQMFQGIISSVIMYFAIAAVLVGIGIVNQKIFGCCYSSIDEEEIIDEPTIALSDIEEEIPEEQEVVEDVAEQKKEKKSKE